MYVTVPVTSVSDPNPDPNPGKPNQCGSMRIRFRIGNANPDPGARKLTKLKKTLIFSLSKMAFCTYADVFYITYIIHK
jgi:hypothetical protein